MVWSSGVLFANEWLIYSLQYFTVLPNDPLFGNPDMPQREFGDREPFPFDNLDTHISDETPLDEIKRMFETLDRLPVQSHVSNDAHSPVAWYKPQQDEPLFDDGSKL